MEVIQQINETDFVIRMNEKDKPNKFSWNSGIHLVHDYIQFDTYTYVPTKGQLTLNSEYNASVNNLTIPVQAQVSIYDMYRIIMPMLKDCKYLQPEHFAKREDGSYGYTYGTSAIVYRHPESNVLMVAYRDSGEREYSHVTKQVYDDYIYPGLLRKIEEKYGK